MMATTFSAVKPRLRFFKFPKLSGPKKVALVLGFIVWFLLGFLLKTRYGGLEAFAIGFGMAYGPMVFLALVLKTSKWISARGTIVGFRLLRLMSASITAIFSVGEVIFFRELLGAVGFSSRQQSLLGVVLVLVTWIIIPMLWCLDISSDPTASA